MGRRTTLIAINSAAMATEAYGGEETRGNHLDKWRISSHGGHHMGGMNAVFVYVVGFELAFYLFTANTSQ